MTTQQVGDRREARRQAIARIIDPQAFSDAITIFERGEGRFMAHVWPQRRESALVKAAAVIALDAPATEEEARECLAGLVGDAPTPPHPHSYDRRDA